jgi:hypothetical protein
MTDKPPSTIPSPDFDVANKFLVAAAPADGTFTLINPPRPRQVLTKAEALNLAAWIVTIVDPDMDDFAKMLAAVHET